MADKFRQIQKFVEILGGLVERSETINKRISDTVDENFALSVSTAQVENEREKTQKGKEDVKNIRLTNSLTRKPPLRVVDMGSGMAYLTFSAHSHLSQKFDLGV
jgi:regulator of replication initiation timing